MLCGEAALECLTQVPESLIEEHHVLGGNHDAEVTVPLCQNCHLKLHERMRREGVDLSEQPTDLERQVHMLRSLAALFQMLGEALPLWALQDEKLINQLDREWPKWRNLSA